MRMANGSCKPVFNLKIEALAEEFALRKNGINRELIAIEGGVCAPEGFSANGVFCGIDASGREDISLIVSNRRCNAACVGASGGVCGAPVTVTKKHLKNGQASVIFANSGVANLGEDGEVFAQNICKALAARLKVDAQDVLIASTGKIGYPFPIDAIINGLPKLGNGLGNTNENSLAAARGLMTTDTMVKQLSYSFYLGDVLCKIGAIFKGTQKSCPNMATTLCFLTTDVKITSPMLQKALSSAVEDTLNALVLGDGYSPNDCACIFANGRAGNYVIECEDSDYKKFRYVLGEVLERVCRKIVLDGEVYPKLLVCKIEGASSKQVARNGAKKLAGAQSVKNSLKTGAEMQTLVCGLMATDARFRMEKAEIFISSENGELAVFHEGRSLSVSPETYTRIMQTKEIEIIVRLNSGNYSATAYGGL